MRLYFDLGNTRAKWSLARARQSLLKGVVNAGDFSGLASQLKLGLRGEVLDGVFVSSVAGVAINSRLNDWAYGEYGLTPVFASVERRAFDVTVGYENIHNLGVDRWLTLVAGRESFAESQIIVDAGSALTVDYLSASGQHLGGFVCPGAGMMIGALFDRTDAVKVSGGLRDAELSLGRDTADCVRNGVLVMIKGFLEEAWQIGRQISCNERLVLTGGDASYLSNLCDDLDFVVDPNLVFAGLKVYSDDYKLKSTQC